MGQLDGKVAFITGAARGQGRSHAVVLAAEGADIIAIDVCEQIDTVPYEMAEPAGLEETAQLVRDQGRRIVARQVDTRDRQAVDDVLRDAVGELGRLDITVANAGITGFASVDMDQPTWNDMIDTNLTGSWNTCAASVPHIRQTGSGGAIVITSSVAGLHVFQGMPHYVTSKHGVVGMMKALAVELGPDLIRVNTVHPTQADTPMLANQYVYSAFCGGDENATREDAAAVSQQMHVLPVPWVDPVDISNAVLFLVSDAGRYITGVSLPVDCGADLIG